MTNQSRVRLRVMPARQLLRTGCLTGAHSWMMCTCALSCWPQRDTKLRPLPAHPLQLRTDQRRCTTPPSASLWPLRDSSSAQPSPTPNPAPLAPCPVPNPAPLAPSPAHLLQLRAIGLHQHGAHAGALALRMRLLRLLQQRVVGARLQAVISQAHLLVQTGVLCLHPGRQIGAEGQWPAAAKGSRPRAAG